METDAEYFENWVEKFDLLCRPKKDVGFIGSCFFIGIICTMFWFPVLSDRIGRTTLILVSLATQMVSYVVLFKTDNLYVGYVCLILMGTTFPGKHVVLYNYSLEVLPKKYHQQMIAMVAFCETFIVVVISFSYQYLSKRWQPLQFIGMIVTGLCLLFSVLFFHESPKFLYINGRFEEARTSLKFIAWFNGMSSSEINARFDFVFDTEAVAR